MTFSVNNDPSQRPQYSRYIAQIYELSFTDTGDQSVCYISPVNTFKPITIIFSDHTKVTLEVCCNKDQTIYNDGNNNGGIWKAVTLSADITQVLTPVNALRITSTSGASTAAVCC
jgi:hypothetical protein